MNIYKELDQIIDEYVGVEPVEQYEFNDEGETELKTIDYVSVDPHLRDAIGKECSEHTQVPQKRTKAQLSPDALKCILEWEELMKTVTERRDDGRDHWNNC